MNKYGFLSPQEYMSAAISEMKQKNDIHIVNPLNWDESIDECVTYCKENNIESVGGYAQKDAYNHILINRGLGNIAPSNLSFLYCMNKYLMRSLESDPLYFDWVDPLNETNDEIAEKIREWPFMLKNTSLSLGRGIFKISNREQLGLVLNEYRQDTKLQEEISNNYHYFMQGISENQMPKIIPPFIAEHFVDMKKTIEYCYEGYIDADGKIVHYALTEEVYFENHQALGYITPPITVDASIATIVENWVDDYMGKLANLGYRNQFFNIEFWLDEHKNIIFTEINPRAAHSYYYNYKLSFDNDLFTDNLELASGKQVSENTPWVKWKAGEFNTYTLIILLTAKEMGKVSDIFDLDYIEQQKANGEISVVRYTRQADDLLTEKDMTSAGAMVLQLWIMGDKDELIEKEAIIRQHAYRNKQEQLTYPQNWQVKEVS
jgi:hypothetical protein